MTPDDRDMLIRTVIGHAEDEPADAQAAVAHALINRAGGQGGDLTGTVMARGQGVWTKRAKELNRIDPASDRYKGVAGVVDDVIEGRRLDPTGGATHFTNETDRHRPRGGSLRDGASGSGLRIGDHTFYKPEEGGAQGAISGALKDEARAPGARAAAMPFDGDFIERESRRYGQPAPKAAAKQDEDFIDRESRRWGEQPAKPAAATVAAKPQSAEISQSSGLPQATLDLLKGSQGHGEDGQDSWGDTAGQIGAGAVRGVGDVADTLAQGIGLAGDKGAALLSRLGVISPESAKSVSSWREGVNRRVTEGNAAWDEASQGRLAPEISRVGGQLAGTAPLLAAGGGALAAATRGAPLVGSIAARPVLAAGVRGVAGGAGAAGLTSASSDQPIGEQVMEGGKWGGIFGTGGKLLGKAFGGGGRLDKGTADLAAAATDKFKIPIRADQLSANPMVRFMGSVAQRMPYTGLGEHVAEQQGALNRAVGAEMGKAADKITPEHIDTVLSDLGKEYEANNKAMGLLNIDRNLISGVRSVRDEARMNLEPANAKIIDKHIQNIASKIDIATGTMKPEQYQYLLRHEGSLDNLINQGGKVGPYAKRLKGQLENLFERNDPALAAERKQIDYKYWVAKAVEPLALESTTGNISPAKLLQAADKSKTDLGQLGRISKQFIQEPPSSGSSERWATMMAAGKLAAGVAGVGGTLGAAHYFDPEHFQQDAVGLAALLAAGRTGGAVLKSPKLAKALIRAGQGPPNTRVPLRRGAIGVGGALESRRVNALEKATSQ